MELLIIVVVFVVSVSLGLVGTRGLLSVVFYLMMRPTPSFEGARAGTALGKRASYQKRSTRQPQASLA